MDWSSTDLPQAFRKFKATCQLYFTGPLKGKTEEGKVSYLLIWTGDEGIELVNTFSLTEDERKKLDTYWTKFEEYVAPKSNFRLARYKLRTLRQEPGEAIDSFLKKIRVLIKECKYTNEDEQIIDALIFGSANPRVQSKLLEHDSSLTLTKVIDIARTAEATQSQLNNIRAAEKPVSVNTLKHSKPQKHSPPQSHPQGKGQDCGNCGTRHSLSQRSLCPAYNSDCNFCHKKHHWERVCKSKAKSQRPRSQQPRGRPSMPNKKVHTLEKVEPTEQAGNQLYFDTIVVNHISQTKTQALVCMQIDSGQLTRELSCNIDTGAEGNILPIDAYMQLYFNTPLDQDGQPQGLKPSTSKITAFGGHVIKQYGTCLLTLTHRDVTNKCAFHVVDTKGPIILGLPTCSDMKLITLNNDITVSPARAAASPAPTAADHPADESSLLREYPKCFEGIGCFEGEFHITLDPTVPPVVHPPRRVPEALREPLKKELDNPEAQDIIAKVTDPTDWVNSLVCVTKSNGTLRLCLDPKDLNKAIKRPHHCTPTIDEVLPRLNGAQYFSIVDARSGYWNIKLDFESSLYTTFNSPHGRYRFLRLPFGLICAQDIFQRKVDETFGDLPGVTGIADDIVIYGKSRAEHDHNLRAVMQRAHEAGIRFNADKCRIGCSELPFFGHIISSTGLKLDPGKVESISNMDPSTSLNDLQTFLGMVQFLSRFIPNLASVAAVLWDLTKSSSEFQ